MQVTLEPSAMLGASANNGIQIYGSNEYAEDVLASVKNESRFGRPPAGKPTRLDGRQTGLGSIKDDVILPPIATP